MACPADKRGEPETAINAVACPNDPPPAGTGSLQ